MKARYDSECGLCGTWICEGDEIRKRDGVWAHATAQACGEGLIASGQAPDAEARHFDRWANINDIRFGSDSDMGEWA